MAEVFTFDGEPPNGGVPAGRLLITRPPVVDELPNGAFQAITGQIVNLLHDALARQARPRIIREAPVIRHAHNHWHLHPTAHHVGIRAYTATPTPTPNSDTHCKIRFVSKGRRPSDSWPATCPFRVEYKDYTFAKTDTMRKVLETFGCPRQAGFGVEQIHRNNVGYDDANAVPIYTYEGGLKYEWNAWTLDQLVGHTELGRGIPGRESWVQKYGRHFAGAG